MLAKKIVVLGIVATALVGLTTACSADTTGDPSASGAEALGGGAPGIYCLNTSNYCECHDPDSCKVLESVCETTGGHWYCEGETTDCSCAWYRKAPTSPTGSANTPTASGTRLAL